MQWSGCTNIGFTISDGELCEAGTIYDKNDSYTFDPAKKITRVECIINRTETMIMQINFFHHDELLVAVGEDEEAIKLMGERREIFEIENNE